MVSLNRIEVVERMCAHNHSTNIMFEIYILVAKNTCAKALSRVNGDGGGADRKPVCPP